MHVCVHMHMCVYIDTCVDIYTKIDCCFVIGSHVVQADFKLVMELRMTEPLILLPPPPKC